MKYRNSQPRVITYSKPPPSDPKPSDPRIAQKGKAIDSQSEPKYQPPPKRATIKIKHLQPQSHPTPISRHIQQESNSGILVTSPSKRTSPPKAQESYVEIRDTRTPQASPFLTVPPHNS